MVSVDLTVDPCQTSKQLYIGVILCSFASGIYLLITYILSSNFDLVSFTAQKLITTIQKPRKFAAIWLLNCTFDVDDPVDGSEATPDGAADDVHEAGKVCPFANGFAKNLKNNY